MAEWTTPMGQRWDHLVMGGHAELEGDFSNALDEVIHTEVDGERIHVTGACWSNWYSVDDVANLIAKRIWRRLP